MKDFTIENRRTEIGKKLNDYPGFYKRKGGTGNAMHYTIKMDELSPFLRSKHLLQENAFMFVDDEEDISPINKTIEISL